MGGATGRGDEADTVVDEWTTCTTDGTERSESGFRDSGMVVGTISSTFADTSGTMPSLGEDIEDTDLTDFGDAFGDAGSTLITGIAANSCVATMGPLSMGGFGTAAGGEESVIVSMVVVVTVASATN